MLHRKTGPDEEHRERGEASEEARPPLPLFFKLAVEHANLPSPPTGT
jgi:hypothetical protein